MRKRINHKDYVDYEKSYQRNEEWIDNNLRGGFRRESTYNYNPPESNKVGNGQWIMIFRDLPIKKEIKPNIYSIYWAVPCSDSKNNDGFDSSGAYKVDILVKSKLQNKFEKVCLFPDEYTVVTDQKLKLYIDEGWELITLDFNHTENIDLNLIENSKILTEEEREIVLSYQIDGLTEAQACQMYFQGSYINYEGSNVYYDCSDEIREYLYEMLGERR